MLRERSFTTMTRGLKIWLLRVLQKLLYFNNSLIRHCGIFRNGVCFQSEIADKQAIIAN